MQAGDGWHLKVREGSRETELAEEKSSLRLRRVDGRSQPEGNVCKGRNNLCETAERGNSPAPKYQFIRWESVCSVKL